MLERFKAYARTTSGFANLLWLVVFPIACLAFAAGMYACSTPPHASTVETDLCLARAKWKAIALAAGGALDPAPGSERAKLEAAEDALCVLVPLPAAAASAP